jgi:hypothetical protein
MTTKEKIISNLKFIGVILFVLLLFGSCVYHYFIEDHSTQQIDQDNCIADEMGGVICY